MDTWGNKLNQVAFTVAEMAAIGMGINKDSFTKRMEGGAHLLAPTGSDLEKNDVGAVFSGFNSDISMMTVHGKGRYPGLHVWTRNWKKRVVKIPEGCLLVQAGMTFEHITGGYIPASFHETIYTEATQLAVQRKHLENSWHGRKQKLWNVSSTMLNHFRNDVSVAPMSQLRHLYDITEADKFPKNFTAYDLLMQELNATGMSDN